MAAMGVRAWGASWHPPGQDVSCHHAPLGQLLGSSQTPQSGSDPAEPPAGFWVTLDGNRAERGKGNCMSGSRA